MKREEKNQQTRQRILTHALCEFAQNGYQGASLAVLRGSGDAAAVSRAGVRRHCTGDRTGTGALHCAGIPHQRSGDPRPASHGRSG